MLAVDQSVTQPLNLSVFIESLLFGRLPVRKIYMVPAFGEPTA